VVMETTYTFFGNSGHLKWDLETEPLGILCGLAGAIIVVAAGLYLRRGSSVVEAEPAASH